MRVAIMLGLAATVAVSGCAQTSRARVSSPGTPTTPSLTGEVHSKADAQARAQADLTLVRLPAGMVRRTTAPSHLLTQPPQTTDVTTLVDDAQWWAMAGSVASVTAYVAAHPPAGFSVPGRETGSDGVTALFFTDDDGHNEIDVSSLQDGGTVDVRVGAQVTWLPAKSDGDTIAPTVQTAQLTYHQPAAKVRKTTVTGTPLARLTAAINGLEVLPPGPPWSCPADSGGHATLTIASGGHSTAYDIDLAGCGFVTVTVDGVAGHTLTGSTNPQGVVRSILGLQQ